MRKPIQESSISKEGIFLIKKFEGFRAEAYKDIVGIPTIGYGSTKNVYMGDVIDEKGATERLIYEIVYEYQPALNKCVEVPLNQSEYDSYISLMYNIGVGAFSRSTLVKLLNQEKYEEAAKQILRWNKAKGKIIPGLVSRRETEYKNIIK